MRSSSDEIRRDDRRRHHGTLVLLSLVCLLWPQDSHAYLDPSTGTMIFQAIAGAFAAMLFALKIYWRRIKAFITRTPVEMPEQPKPSSSSSTPPKP